MSTITWSPINQKPVNKKILTKLHIYLHLFANLWLKIQNTQHYRNSGTFHHLENWHLMAQQKAQQWYSQKSKID